MCLSPVAYHSLIEFKSSSIRCQLDIYLNRLTVTMKTFLLQKKWRQKIKRNINRSQIVHKSYRLFSKQKKQKSNTKALSHFSLEKFFVSSLVQTFFLFLRSNFKTFSSSKWNNENKIESRCNSIVITVASFHRQRIKLSFEHFSTSQ